MEFIQLGLTLFFIQAVLGKCGILYLGSRSSSKVNTFNQLMSYKSLALSLTLYIRDMIYNKIS